ncbi:MAG: efflux RND transporter periplasmic adaptor subunit [Nitrospirae bacterium]|nr:efflux RND transporter periplasmic adaptor subunit [Nitrospirota bacterium]
MKPNAIIISGLLMSLLFLIKTPSSYSQHQHGAPAGETAKPQTQGAAPEEGGDEENTVEIETEKQQLIGVKTVEVAVMPLQKIIRTVGRIEYDERKLAVINTKFEGWIEKLYIDYTGRYVKKGEPLAEIFSPELLATQQEFINLLKWSQPPAGNIQSQMETMLSKDAEKIIDAARQRLRLWDISDEQIEKIRETKTPVRTLTIYSPASGYVIEKMAVNGMKVMPGEKLFTIADLSSLWILADIYEYELSMVQTGQKARITLSYFPGKEISSVIDYVYPSLSDTTRTAKVRFQIPNVNNKLKPQMFTNIEIKIDLGKRLAIPDDAVIDTGTRQVVYVDKGEGEFEPREVMLGVRAEGFREVLMGLKAGEKVASSATFLIDSEAQLKGVKPMEHKH